MLADHFATTMKEIAGLYHMYAALLDVGLLVFARLMGFILLAPIFGRKDIPFTIKMSLALALTWIILPQIPAHLPAKTLAALDEPVIYSIQILINITIGAIIGFIADCILEVINSAGDLMNNQIGLSSAMLFDPGRGAQVALLDKFFSFLGMMVFFELGGVYWLINAINRSFHVFPIYTHAPRHHRPNQPDLSHPNNRKLPGNRLHPGRPGRRGHHGHRHDPRHRQPHRPTNPSLPAQLCFETFHRHRRLPVYVPNLFAFNPKLSNRLRADFLGG